MKKILVLSVIMFSSAILADICGKEDNRRPSHDKKVGRFILNGETSGCTAALIGRSCFVTLGHCAEKKDYVEFNVPTSNVEASQSASLEDTYRVDPSFYMISNKGVGSQWAVLKLLPNVITGEKAGDIQGFFSLVNVKPKKNDPIKVIQYGQTADYAQLTSSGKLIRAGIFLMPEVLEFDADTSYGSGGAPIVNERTGELIGINTHGGCKLSDTGKIGPGRANSGTSIYGSKSFRNAIESCLKSE